MEVKTEKTIYRVQGGNLSKPTIRIGESYHIQSFDEHLFVSKSKKHHEYYLGKRIIQYIIYTIMENRDTPYQKKWIKNHVFDEIYETVPTANFETPLTALQIEILPTLYQLLEENSLSTITKHMHKSRYWLPKKVDEKKLEGGYHISKLWLKLLHDSLLCITYRVIDKEAMYSFLTMIKQEIELYNREYIEFEKVLNHTKKCQLYNRYSIEEGKDIIYKDMREILKYNAYTESSILQDNPDQTIEKMITEFEQSKIFSLKKNV